MTMFFFRVACFIPLMLIKMRFGASYLGDTRPEFKIWGGASKSVFVLVVIYLSTSI